MPSDSPNPNNTTPAVVEKACVDIDLRGGVDESTSELAVDWTKRWLQAENLVVDGAVMRPRPGQSGFTGQPDGPLFRLAALDDGLGAVTGIDYQLSHHNEASGPTGTVVGMEDKGILPEWSVTTRKFGADQGVGGLAGSLGFANLTYYDAIAYVTSIGIGNQATIEVMDKNSNNIVFRWTWLAIDRIHMFSMVGVDGRYLHCYVPGDDDGEGPGPVLGPSVFVIDTQNPPASGDISSISRTNLTLSFATGNTWEIGAVTPITGGSVVVMNHRAHDNSVHMEQFNNTSPAPASVRNVDISNFSYVTGLDVDSSGNLYLAGYKRLAFDPATAMALTGWWRATYSGAPWVPTASLGSSGTNGNLAPGTAPLVGAALNGLTPPDFVPASNHALINSNLAGTFLSTAGFSIAILFNADTAAADNGTSCYLNSQMFSDRDPTANTTAVGVSFSTSGVVAWVRDTVGVAKTRSAAACATGGWHLAKVTWNGATKTLKCSVDATVLPAGSVSVNALVFATSVVGVGATVLDTTNFDGRIAEVMTSNTVFLDADFDNIRDYINNRYALSL